MLNLSIRTRGWKTDYCFLLEENPRVPNFNTYKTDIERPTCILECTEKNEGYLFLSGIPSQRKDHQGTTLRYDLVATFNLDPLEDDSWDNNSPKKQYLMGLTNVILLWLNDVRFALKESLEDDKSFEDTRLPVATNSKLGKLIDDILSQQYIDQVLQLTNNRNWTQDNKNKLDNQLKEILQKSLEVGLPKVNLPEQQIDLPEQELDLPTWWGGVNNDESCNKWLKLVENLILGKTKGKALLLNIATPSSLGRLSVKKDENLGVLLAKEWSRSQPEPIKLKTSQKTKLLPFTQNLPNNVIKTEEEVKKKGLLQEVAQKVIQKGKKDINEFKGFFRRSD